MKKLFISIVLIFVSLALVSALTASVGNSRMVLRAEANEVLEKYIQVKNVNDVDVTIEFIPAGDLKNYITMKDNNFTLTPGEEKKAYFTIKSPIEGTSTSKINVKFTPEDGDAVGLSSTVIFVAGNSTTPINGTDFESESSFSSLFDFNDNEKTSTSEESKPFSISPAILLSLSTLILFLILIILVVYSNKRKKRAKMK